MLTSADKIGMGQSSRCLLDSSTRVIALSLAMMFAQSVIGSPVVPANDSPQSFTLDGQLFSAGTQTPLLDSAAKITLDILDPSRTCILYEEQQTVNTSTTNGYYNIEVGSATGNAKRTTSDPHNTMAQVYQNFTVITGTSAPGQTCAGGLYTPALGDIRYFRITVTPSSTGIADTLSPDTVMSAVPMANVAQTLQGLEPTAFLQVNTSGGVNLSQTALDSLFTGTAYTNLQNVENGQYMPSTSTGAADLPTYTTASPPTTPVAGSVWYNSTTNTIEYYNGTTTQALGTGSATPSGAAGAVQISGGSSLASDATHFFWDTTNHRLGIGTATPSYPLDAKGSVVSGPVISGVNADTTSASYGVYGSANSTTLGTSGVYGTVSGAGYVYGVAGVATAATGYAVGVYASSAGYAGGINGSSTNTGAWGQYGVQGTCQGSTCYGVKGNSSDTSGNGYGGYFNSSSTGAGTGVYGAETGASNTGYAGYFTNSSTTGWGVYSAGSSPNYFAGNIEVGASATIPATNLDVRDDINSTPFPLAVENESPANSGVGAGIEFLGKNGSAQTGQKIATIEGQWDAANDNGDLNFSVNDNGTMKNAMDIDFSGGIGFPWRTNYVGFDLKNSVGSQGTGVAYGTEIEQTITANANNDALTGLVINPTFNDNSKTGVTHNGLLVEGGNVGINNTSPRATLDVQGGSLLTNPETVNTTSTVDFSKGNIQYTTSSCGAFTFDNMKDGGTYTFVVKGTTAASCSFSAYSDAGVTALTVHMPPDNGATTAGKQTLYSLLVAGTDVYVAWTPGY